MCAGLGVGFVATSEERTDSGPCPSLGTDRGQARHQNSFAWFRFTERRRVSPSAIACLFETRLHDRFAHCSPFAQTAADSSLHVQSTTRPLLVPAHVLPTFSPTIRAGPVKRRRGQIAAAVDPEPAALETQSGDANTNLAWPDVSSQENLVDWKTSRFPTAVMARC